MSQAKVLSAQGLTKDFGSGKGAIDINLEISPGEIVGYIGPNRSGKSTTIAMLTGLIYPDRGSVEIMGKKLRPYNIQTAMSDLGVLYQHVSFPNLKVQQRFQYLSSLWKQDLKRRYTQLADLYELNLDTRFSKLSAEDKKKVGIIAAMLHSPKLLILDEPLVDLEPTTQREFLVQLQRFKDEGGSVLISSKHLSDVEKICDRIVLIKNGAVVFTETAKNVAEMALKMFKLRNLPQTLTQELLKLETVKKSLQQDKEFHIYVQDSKQVIDLLAKEGIYDYLIERPSLEETFIISNQR